MPQKHESPDDDRALADTLDYDFDRLNIGEIHTNFQPLSGSIPASQENLAFYYFCRNIHPVRKRQCPDNDTSVLEDFS